MPITWLAVPPSDVTVEQASGAGALLAGAAALGLPDAAGLLLPHAARASVAVAAAVAAVILFAFMTDSLAGLCRAGADICLNQVLLGPAAVALCGTLLK